MRLRPGGLFWRTFFLIATLILASLLAWSLIFRAFERAPRAQQVAWELASVANLTRAALVSADPARRRALLDDLARDEGVSVEVLEPDDRVEAVDAAGFPAEVAIALAAVMGPGTRTGAVVNGVRGFWVSFDIEGDAYWLRIDEARVDRRPGPGWAAWALTAIGLSLAGAFATSRLVNRPLEQLARAISALARGRRPAPLAERGPEEIARLNSGFNRMAQALGELEADRALALAGISHDVRTPLTRLRMEVELADLPEPTRRAMESDIESIDRIVGQFVEFARGTTAPPQAAAAVVPADMLDGLRARHAAEIASGSVDWDAGGVDRTARWHGQAADFERIAANLVENAMRHGRDPAGRLALEVRLQRMPRGVRLSVVDHGAGVPPGSLARLTRPFMRLDPARGASGGPSGMQANGGGGGTGLGLAIVERLAQRHGGRLVLATPEGGGFSATVELPDAR